MRTLDWREQVLPSRVPRPRVTGICLWIPNRELPPSGKGTPSEPCWEQTFSIISSKTPGRSLAQEVPVACSPSPSLCPLTFPIKHLCFGHTRHISSVFRQKCLCFYSDTTKIFPGRVFSAPLKKVYSSLTDKGREQKQQLGGLQTHPNTWGRSQPHPDTWPWSNPHFTRCHVPDDAQGRSRPPAKARPQLGAGHSPTRPRGTPSPAPAIPLTLRCARGPAPRYLLAVLAVPRQAHLPVAALAHGPQEAVGSQGHPPASGPGQRPLP